MTIFELLLLYILFAFLICIEFTELGVIIDLRNLSQRPRAALFEVDLRGQQKLVWKKISGQNENELFSFSSNWVATSIDAPNGKTPKSTSITGFDIPRNGVRSDKILNAFAVYTFFKYYCIQHQNK